MLTKNTKPAAGTAGIKPKENYLSENSIIKFRFHEDDLDVVRDGEKVWVAVKRACENLGLAVQPQLTKLHSKPWARVTMIVTPSKDSTEDVP